MFAAAIMQRHFCTFRNLSPGGEAATLPVFVPNPESDCEQTGMYFFLWRRAAVENFSVSATRALHFSNSDPESILKFTSRWPEKVFKIFFCANVRVAQFCAGRTG